MRKKNKNLNVILKLLKRDKDINLSYYLSYLISFGYNIVYKDFHI